MKILPASVKSAIILLGYLFATAIMVSCEDESEAKKQSYEVSYEVITASNGWFGEYIIETGEKVCHCSAPLLPSGWTYSFSVDKKPFVLHIDATVDGYTGQEDTPDITTNIYVNNELVATNTSNWIKGVASADFEIK
jgi:hypothetical protein